MHQGGEDRKREGGGAVMLQQTVECHNLQQYMRSCTREEKRDDHNFQRQFGEKPSIIPGCTGVILNTTQGK